MIKLVLKQHPRRMILNAALTALESIVVAAAAAAHSFKKDSCAERNEATLKRRASFRHCFRCRRLVDQLATMNRAFGDKINNDRSLGQRTK